MTKLLLSHNNRDIIIHIEIWNSIFAISRNFPNRRYLIGTAQYSSHEI